MFVAYKKSQTGPWLRHEMERIYVLLSLCEASAQVASGILSQYASNGELLCFYTYNVMSYKQS